MIRRAALALALALTVTAAPAAVEQAPANASHYYASVVNKGRHTLIVTTPRHGNKHVPAGFSSRYLGIPTVGAVLPVRSWDGRKPCFLYRNTGTSRWNRTPAPGATLFLRANQRLDVHMFYPYINRYACY